MSDKKEVTRPSSYYGGEAELWTCIFPGKMGISWKLAWYNCGTRAEAEARAAKHRNVVAIPWALWLRYKEYEQRSVVSERKLQEELSIRVDYVVKPGEVYGEPTFIPLGSPSEPPSEESP